MILMRVLGLTLDATDKSPILVLREAKPSPGASSGTGGRVLPIWLGMTEAMHLSMALHHVRLPRPLPHDLLVAAINALGGRITGATLTGLRDGVFYARIEIAAGEMLTLLDCRPSDAVLVALRCGVDVMADESVFQAAQRGRLTPGMPDTTRRPLDSAEALIREAGRHLLESAGQRQASSDTKEPPSGADAETTPEQALILAGVSGTLGDDEELAELLRRIKPASRRVM